jgi:hypothetical protein
MHYAYRAREDVGVEAIGCGPDARRPARLQLSAAGKRWVRPQVAGYTRDRRAFQDHPKGL